MAIQELSKHEIEAVAGGGDGLLGLGVLDGLLPAVLGLVGTVLSLPLVESLLGVVTNTLGKLTK